MFDLDRFKRAQAAPHAGFADALRELRDGQKTSHWIWYVFPQLAGLGRSPNAVRYGLAGPEEAAAYLRDPVLAPRLMAAAAAARAHLAPASSDTADTETAARIDDLMGSDIDAIKLVSSMTLFLHVAAKLHAETPSSELAVLIADADAILAAAAQQGYPRCAFTEQQLRTG